MRFLAENEVELLRPEKAVTEVQSEMESVSALDAAPAAAKAATAHAMAVNEDSTASWLFH